MERPFVKKIGTLLIYASQKREEGHAFLLSGRLKEAEKSIDEAEKAYEWGSWRQLQVNAIRSMGWVHLRAGRYDDASEKFETCKKLCEKYRGVEGEMLLDEVKARIELRRLCFIRGKPDMDNELPNKLVQLRKQLEDSSEGQYKWLKNLYDNPPSHKWPLTDILPKS